MAVVPPRVAGLVQTFDQHIEAYRSQQYNEMQLRKEFLDPLLARRASFALIPTELRGRLCPMASGGFTINLPIDASICPEYLLGLLNSKLLYWSLEQSSNIFRGGWITCTKQYFGQLPIRIPDSTRDRERNIYDLIISLVRKMLDLQKQLASAKIPGERTRIQRQTMATDKQIDKLVYQLYALTDEEIAIVENSAKS